MRVIARTSRNTGVSAGPLGLLLLAIGGLIYLVAMAIVAAMTFLAAGVMLGVGEIRRRRATLRVR
jgi:hypothetical protein